MPIHVKAHRRGKSVVKAYTRGSTVRLNKEGRSMLSLAALRNQRLKVLKSSTVHFASGPQKYHTVEFFEKNWAGRRIKTTREVPQRFLTAKYRLS